VVFTQFGTHFNVTATSFPSRGAAARFGSSACSVIGAVVERRTLGNFTGHTTPYVSQAVAFTVVAVTSLTAYLAVRTDGAFRVLARLAVKVGVALASGIRASTSSAALQTIFAYGADLRSAVLSVPSFVAGAYSTVTDAVVVAVLRTCLL